MKGQTYFCDRPDHGWSGFCPCPFCRADNLTKALVRIKEEIATGISIGYTATEWQTLAETHIRFIRCAEAE